MVVGKYERRLLFQPPLENKAAPFRVFLLFTLANLNNEITPYMSNHNLDWGGDVL